MSRFWSTFFLLRRCDIESGMVWMGFALRIWIVLAVAVCVKSIVQPFDHSVYPVFAEGARHWWADMPLYIAYHGTDLFRYSPAFALFMTPFSCFPHWLGGIFWNLFNIGLYLCGAHVLVREVLPGTWSIKKEALWLALIGLGSIRGIWSGQSNTLLMALVFFGLAAVARKRWWSAAWLLMGPVFLKLWPIALVMLLAARWPKQLIGRFAATFAALALIPFATRPLAIVVDHYCQWYTALSATSGVRWAGFRDAWTLMEPFGRPNMTLMWTLRLTTAVAVLGWTLYQARRSERTKYYLANTLAMWAGWILLFGPSSERLTYLILAPVAGWIVLEAFSRRQGRTWATMAWITLFALGTGGVERALKPTFAAAPAILPFGVVLLIAWLLWYQRGPIEDEPVLPEAKTAETVESSSTKSWSKTNSHAA